MRQVFVGATVPNPSALNYDAISVGENKTCEGLRPEAGTLVFPNPARQTWIDTVFLRKNILPAARANFGALFVQGCFAYETMNEIHRTWFCMVLYRNGQFASRNSTTFCKDGQGAD